MMDQIDLYPEDAKIISSAIIGWDGRFLENCAEHFNRPHTASRPSSRQLLFGTDCCPYAVLYGYARADSRPARGHEQEPSFAAVLR